MFDSITFLSNLYFSYAARCVHFTVPSGERDVVFFLRGQMYAFIKKPLSIIVLVWVGNT